MHPCEAAAVASRTIALLLVAGAVLAGGAGTADATNGTRADRHAVRHVAQQYLDAIAHRDAATICHILSPRARRELVEEEDTTTCRAAASHIPAALGHFPVVRVVVHRPTAVAIIGDAAISDSGNDSVPLVRRHGHWLLDGV